MKIAIVLGGSERVWDDAARAQRFCVENTLEPEWFATNDMIALFQSPIVAVTLHPDKLSNWLLRRRNDGLPAPTRVYSHNGGDNQRKPNCNITHRITDWGGSVGMFGYVAARDMGHDRVILCGVPMTSDNHFVRKSKWIAVSAFTRQWENKKTEMLPHCRSLSGGMTGTMLGEPTAEWAMEMESITCSATG